MRLINAHELPFYFVEIRDDLGIRGAGTQHFANFSQIFVVFVIGKRTL